MFTRFGGVIVSSYNNYDGFLNFLPLLSLHFMHQIWNVYIPATKFVSNKGGHNFTFVQYHWDKIYLFEILKSFIYKFKNTLKVIHFIFIGNLFYHFIKLNFVMHLNIIWNIVLTFSYMYKLIIIRLATVYLFLLCYLIAFLQGFTAF